MSTILPLLHTAWTIFLALMILNVMILVHEWGHFLAARWRGLKVDKFQIWFGQPIWKRTWNGVQYGIGWIPAGGFVTLPQMAPMDAIEGAGEEPRASLPPITPLDKIIVAFAGPLFSIMLAVVFAVMVWKVGRPINEPAEPTQIGYIAPDMPAAQSDLKIGDIIRAIDGQPVQRWNGQVNSVIWGIVSSHGDQIIFTVERDGRTLDVPVTPKLVALDGSTTPATGPVARLTDFVFKRPPLRKVGLVGRAPTLRVDSILPQSTKPACAQGMCSPHSTVSPWPILSCSSVMWKKMAPPHSPSVSPAKAPRWTSSSPRVNPTNPRPLNAQNSASSRSMTPPFVPPTSTKPPLNKLVKVCNR